MNKLIKGDSLEALQAMNDDSVDLIYIDPPYYFNTSRRGAFNYNSDFELADWKHLMSVRLIEAKRVMNKEAIIFISTNEDGMPYLRIICDEIFGEKNFVENFIWNNSNAIKNNSTTTSTTHEYVLCYAKNKVSISNRTYFRKKKKGVEKALSLYTSMKKAQKPIQEIEEALKLLSNHPSYLDLHGFSNADEVGIYKKDNLSAPSPKNKKTYDVLHPVTRQPCKLPSTGWRFTEESMQELLDQNRIAFGEDHTTVPSRRSYLYAPQFNEDKTYNIVTSLIDDTSRGKNDLLELFDEAPFAFPKPVSLIKTLIAMHPKKDIKVLDFFAGSGTTGHAVMELNKEDGGSRSFILVEQMDYAEDLTKERIIRAMSKYEYDESFTYEVFDSHGQEDDASQELVKADDAS